MGETLTADTSGIDDDDGLDNVAFSYQWLRDDAAIAAATGGTYTLVAADEGKTIKVTVSFTDAKGNPETLTSDPTGEVAPDPGPLTVFTLVDTSTDPDKMLGTLEDGIALTLTGPAGDSYGIRVDTDSNHDDHDDIHKVVLALSGRKDVNKPEWKPPTPLYGDSGEENLTGEDLPAGSYDLTARPTRIMATCWGLSRSRSAWPMLPGRGAAARSEHPCHGSAHHRRHRTGGRDADGGHLRHPRR